MYIYMFQLHVFVYLIKYVDSLFVLPLFFNYPPLRDEEHSVELKSDTNILFILCRKVAIF